VAGDPAAPGDPGALEGLVVAEDQDAHEAGVRRGAGGKVVLLTLIKWTRDS
jgi:hypothetical protein